MNTQFDDASYGKLHTDGTLETVYGWDGYGVNRRDPEHAAAFAARVTQWNKRDRARRDRSLASWADRVARANPPERFRFRVALRHGPDLQRTRDGLIRAGVDPAQIAILYGDEVAA